MKQYPLIVIIGLIVAIFMLDLYTFRGIRLLTADMQPWIRSILFTGYWAFTAFLIPAILITALNFQSGYNHGYQLWVSFLVGITLLTVVSKAVFALFHGFGDMGYYAPRLVEVFQGSATAADSLPGPVMDRRTFVTRIGLAVAAIPFLSISYGMVRGKFNYRVISQTLSFSNLPAAFDGLRVVQISDMHLGSFNRNYGSVERGIDMINALEPDLILFTGDIVNNYAQETEGWQPVLSRLHARMGKYAVLGNHDYGDYGDWPDEASKAENARKIRDFLTDSGFRLLLNEAEMIAIGDDSIALVGVENWGLPPFKQYGNLQAAMRETGDAPFKLLLSHDPSHWDAEVIGQTDIDLTLAGHTHGAQFGVEVGNIKWSPVKMKYPRWAGLYEQGKQYLYVNRGFGFIGFPGRVGIAPEITLLQLETAAKAT